MHDCDNGFWSRKILTALKSSSIDFEEARNFSNPRCLIVRFNVNIDIGTGGSNCSSEECWIQFYPEEN